MDKTAPEQGTTATAVQLAALPDKTYHASI
jgi:hypothetical protein